MADDVRIATSLRRHRKTKRLKRLLGGEGCWALVCLFLWAGEERWTGDLSGLSDDDIEEEADWSGEPGALVAALLEVRFLIGEPGARAIHEWQEHNPYAATKGARIEKGKRAAAARWHRDDAAKDAPSMPGACGEHAKPLIEQCPPAPAPTKPDQQQEPEPEQKKARKRAAHPETITSIKGVPVPAKPEHVAEQAWGDWLGLRKAKSAPVTETVLREAEREAGKAGLSLTRFLEIWCSRGSQGLQADWLKPNELAQARAGPTAARPMGKQEQGLRALEAMKSGNRVAAGRAGDGVPETLLLGAGTHAGG